MNDEYQRDSRHLDILALTAGTCGLLFRLEININIPHGSAPIVLASLCWGVAAGLCSRRRHVCATAFILLLVESIRHLP